MVQDISVHMCSQSCRFDSILQKSDAFPSNRLSRNIKAVIAISHSFALQKNSRIYEFLYSQRLLRHDFNNFCSMWNKNRLSQQNICFAIIWSAGQVVYIKPNFWICTDFVFVFCFIDHFSEFLAAMKTPLYIGQRARCQKLHILYAQRKGSYLSKYCRYFSFRSLVKIFCLVQNWRRKACALVFLSAFTVPIAIPFYQTKTTLSPLYSRICRLLSLLRIYVDFHSLYA